MSEIDVSGIKIKGMSGDDERRRRKFDLKRKRKGKTRGPGEWRKVREIFEHTKSRDAANSY